MNPFPRRAPGRRCPGPLPAPGTAGPARVPRPQGRPALSRRRTLYTGTDKQAQRLRALFTADEHVEVEATWGIYQRRIAAYRQEDRRRSRKQVVDLVDSISTGVPKSLSEVITLGRTLKKRAEDTWPTLTGPAPPTDRPRRSTDESSISEAPPSGSATSPTISPGPARDRRIQAPIHRRIGV
jgi:hypothetical protein